MLAMLTRVCIHAAVIIQRTVIVHSCSMTRVLMLLHVYLLFVYIQIIPNGEEMVPAALYLAEAMLANPIVVSADD